MDSRLWDAVIPALARHHDVIRYDARGLGRSTPPGAALRRPGRPPHRPGPLRPHPPRPGRPQHGRQLTALLLPHLA
nr:hypothetical protein [Streptomyces sp. CBMA123]